MKNTSTKPVGDKLFIKTDFKSPWEPARLSDLKALLDNRDTPFSSKEKLNLPQFGYGREEGQSTNKQLYPTKAIVLELDTPSPDKGELDNKDVFKKWSNTFKSIYRKILKDEELPYKIMYLTPSMCGLRFVVQLDNPIQNEFEYRRVVQQYIKRLENFGVVNEFLDFKVNCGWFLPTYSAFYSFRRKTFCWSKESAKSNSNQPIKKAIRLTEESKSFEDGNRNRFIYSLGQNANRLGIEKQVLLDYIIESDFAYDTKEIKSTINSAYKRTEDFGMWKGRTDIENATVSLNSLFKRAKNTKPIPVVWSGIKKGSLGFVFGPSKSGKSTLCECLAMSLETGMDSFMGLPLTGQKHKVLFLSMEEYWEQRIERNRQQRTYLHKSFKKKLGGNYFTNNEKFPTHFLNDSDLKFIELEINKHEPEIVFIDSFTRLVLEKVEDSTRTNKVMSKLKQMCKDTGATFVLIHHTIKSKDKLLTITDMAGSRVLSQEADFLIGITRAANDRRYMKDIAFRYAPEREKITPFEINESRWVIPMEATNEAELIERKDGRKDDSNKLAIFDFIKSSDGPVSSSDIKDHFAEAMSKKTIFNNLNKLQDEEAIERIGKGFYKCSVDNKE